MDDSTKSTEKKDQADHSPKNEAAVEEGKLRGY